MNRTHPGQHVDPEALQTRVGRRLRAALVEQTDALPQDICERLRVARELALHRARSARQAAAAVVPVGRQPGGAATLSSAPSSRWWSLASAVPLLVLVLGLMMIQRIHDQAQIDVTSKIDEALLADNLPPTAYRDPGFIEFLKRTER